MSGAHGPVAITGARGRPQGITTVVFDFDDTLADTWAARTSAVRQAFAGAGVTEPTAEAFMAAARGRPFDKALDGFDGGRGAALGLFPAYRRAYWLKGPGLISLHDGVPEMLEGLASRGMRLGVLTSKTREMTVEGRRAGALVEMAELGIDRYFTHVVGFEDVARHKPDPEGLMRLLAALGSTPAETLVVGDSASDVLVGRGAGAWSALAGWGVPPGERDGLAVPDVVVEHPSALLGLLTGSP